MNFKTSLSLILAICTTTTSANPQYAMPVQIPQMPIPMAIPQPMPMPPPIPMPPPMPMLPMMQHVNPSLMIAEISFRKIGSNSQNPVDDSGERRKELEAKIRKELEEERKKAEENAKNEQEAKDRTDNQKSNIDLNMSPLILLMQPSMMAMPAPMPSPMPMIQQPMPMALPMPAPMPMMPAMGMGLIRPVTLHPQVTQKPVYHGTRSQKSCGRKHGSTRLYPDSDHAFRSKDNRRNSLKSDRYRYHGRNQNLNRYGHKRVNEDHGHVCDSWCRHHG